jgi:hypothetical protein
MDNRWLLIIGWEFNIEDFGAFLITDNQVIELNKLNPSNDLVKNHSLHKDIDICASDEFWSFYKSLTKIEYPQTLKVCGQITVNVF